MSTNHPEYHSFELKDGSMYIVEQDKFLTFLVRNIDQLKTKQGPKRRRERFTLPED